MSWWWWIAGAWLVLLILFMFVWSKLDFLKKQPKK